MICTSQFSKLFGTADALEFHETVATWNIIFTAGRPKAALLLWFFGDFRCGGLLFVAIHVIYNYKNR